MCVSLELISINSMSLTLPFSAYMCYLNINEELAIPYIPYINHKFHQKAVPMEIPNILDFE